MDWSSHLVSAARHLKRGKNKPSEGKREVDRGERGAIKGGDPTRSLDIAWLQPGGLETSSSEQNSILKASMLFVMLKCEL